jgi:hypothetical protein
VPKVKISDYSQTAASNTDINSINLGEGMLPSDVNNAIRELMKQLKDFQVGAQGDPQTVGGNLVVSGTSNLIGTTTIDGLQFPTADGTNGQVIKTNGSGVLSFVTSATGDVTTTGTQTLENKTLVAPILLASTTTTQDGVILTGRAGGSSSYRVTVSPNTLSANRAVTLPDAAGAVVIDTASQTLTNKTLTDPAIIGAIAEDVFTITDGAAFEIDPGNGSIQLITLGASRTPKATNFAAGESVTLMVDDGTAYTLTWTDSTFGGSGVVWKTNGGVAPTLNTSGYTVITLWKVSTQVYGARVGDA